MKEALVLIEADTETWTIEVQVFDENGERLFPKTRIVFWSWDARPEDFLEEFWIKADLARELRARGSPEWKTLAREALLARESYERAEEERGEGEPTPMLLDQKAQELLVWLEEEEGLCPRSSS